MAPGLRRTAGTRVQGRGCSRGVPVHLPTNEEDPPISAMTRLSAEGALRRRTDEPRILREGPGRVPGRRARPSLEPPTGFVIRQFNAQRSLRDIDFDRIPVAHP